MGPFRGIEGYKRCSVFGWLMVRLFYIVVISSLLASCGVFGLCVRQWHQADPQHEALLQAPSAVRMFMESAEEREGDGVNQVSPLVAQAEILAAYLNPPKPAKEKTPAAPVTQAKGAEAAPVVRPATASVKFKLHGTSYYPNQPGRSMALISEVGAAEGSERWVKKGPSWGIS